MDCKYVYNSDGEKMKAIYFTPFPREVVNPVLDDTVVARPPIRGGQMNAKRRVEIYPSNPPAEVGIHDSLVYCGNFIYSNQSLEQVLFDGGYMTLDSLGLPHYHFYQHDHLGSVRAVVDENGVTEERDDYYPFGATYGQDAKPNVRRYKYNGKELDRMHGQNLLDYGARWYDALLARFTTMDPLCEKYYHISPYAYCANNPVNAVDPDGRIVIPYGNQALSIIRNTLPQDARQYVTLNSNGYIDVNRMKQYKGESNNYKSLLTLADSKLEISVTTLQETQYNKNGETSNEKFNTVEVIDDFADKAFDSCSGNTTGECGNLGVTYMPSDDGTGKVDAKEPNTIHININPSLSSVGAAEAFSHEGYGHALIFIESGGDRKRAVHHFVGTKETNGELSKKSIRARKETIKNMGL